VQTPIRTRNPTTPPPPGSTAAPNTHHDGARGVKAVQAGLARPRALQEHVGQGGQAEPTAQGPHGVQGGRLRAARPTAGGPYLTPCTLMQGRQKPGSIRVLEFWECQSNHRREEPLCQAPCDSKGSPCKHALLDEWEGIGNGSGVRMQWLFPRPARTRGCISGPPRSPAVT
jgi:hypothetical protein